MSLCFSGLADDASLFEAEISRTRPRAAALTIT